jgi:hypothetical protein
MASTIAAIDGEYRRYKALGEAAIAQLDEADLSRPGPGDGNSIAIIVWHLAGHLASRFTDFLTTDGEKEWRRRDEEFEQRTVTTWELLKKWSEGWGALFTALGTLSDADMVTREITIRRQPLRVDAALYRSLAHASYHVGQIVYLAKAFRGAAWKSLSIPPGQSETYNKNPGSEAATAHAARLSQPNMVRSDPR